VSEKKEPTKATHLIPFTGRSLDETSEIALTCSSATESFHDRPSRRNCDVASFATYMQLAAFRDAERSATESIYDRSNHTS
jgi:hypothetical protein